MSVMETRQGFVIPVYNHAKAAGVVVEKLSSLKLPIILVDDGCDQSNKTLLREIESGFPETRLVTREKNGGKGAAVIAGIDKARELGLSHVLQIDADGQHDESRAVFFFDQSRLNPEAVICGMPEYDSSVPLIRLKGRAVSNTWAKIVTLSDVIVDALCGFRVYPVEKVLKLCRGCFFDLRMGFDVEILVRLYWAGAPLVFHPVKVVYPEGGLSHFHPVKDNIRISWVFTRLCCGMILRWPRLLRRGLKQKNAESGRRTTGAAAAK